MITAENMRFHAAGHIAAAIVLVEAGLAEQARKIMQVVTAFVASPNVSAPPQVVEKVASVTLAPNSVDLRILEQWFCDPLNAIIERSGS